MKKQIVLIVLFLFSLSLSSQNTGDQIDQVIDLMRNSTNSENSTESLLKDIIQEPQLYNIIWSGLLEKAKKKDPKKWKNGGKKIRDYVEKS